MLIIGEHFQMELFHRGVERLFIAGEISRNGIMKEEKLRFHHFHLERKTCW